MQLPNNRSKESDHHSIQRKEAGAARQSGHKASSAPRAEPTSVANTPGDRPATTHRDKRAWRGRWGEKNNNTSSVIETEQTNIWGLYESMRNEKNNPTKTPFGSQNEERNKSNGRPPKKHLRAERWTSGFALEEQVYIPPEERQQPKSWEQTNKRRGEKETKNNQIKW